MSAYIAGIPARPEKHLSWLWAGAPLPLPDSLHKPVTLVARQGLEAVQVTHFHAMHIYELPKVDRLQGEYAGACIIALLLGHGV